MRIFKLFLISTLLLVNIPISHSTTMSSVSPQPLPADYVQVSTATFTGNIFDSSIMDVQLALNQIDAVCATTSTATGQWDRVGTNLEPKTSGDSVYLDTGNLLFGTSTPDFRITGINDAGMVMAGTFGSGNTLTTSGTASKLIWYPRKAAFRAGFSSTSEFDDVNIGIHSIGLGQNVKASGLGSFCAIGGIATATRGACIGTGTLANSFNGINIGRNNIGIANHIDSATVDYLDDPIFEVGIGASAGARANAMTVLKNGTVSFNTYTTANGILRTDASGVISSSINLPNGTTGTTQAPSDNTTKVATTAYVDAAVVGGGLWSRTAPRLSPATSTDSVYIPSGDLLFGTTTPEFNITGVTDSGMILKGVYESGDTLTTTGAGTRLIWYPRRAAFRAGGVSGTQWDDGNIGSYSTAFGVNCRAAGANSFAVGEQCTVIPSATDGIAIGKFCTANGTVSVAIGSSCSTGLAGFQGVAIGTQSNANNSNTMAIGYQCTASGELSTAIGELCSSSAAHSRSFGTSCISTGEYSMAFGYNNLPKNYRETVMGSFATTVTGSATTWVATDPLFTIGNGQTDTPRSNALQILKNGDINIGNTTSDLKITGTEDAGLLLSGTYGSGDTLTTAGAGTKMIWYPRKSAFRAGLVTGTEWNDANIGELSAAFGYNTQALGAQSFVCGNRNSTSVSAVNSFVAGSDSSATEAYSIAMGLNCTATGVTSRALGTSAVSAGANSTAIGFGVNANSYREIALGSYNVLSGGSGAWVGTYTLFSIGNSEYGTARSNAMTVLKNGTVKLDAYTTANGILTTAADGTLSSSIALPNGTTATTQLVTDDSTKVATTAFAHDITDNATISSTSESTTTANTYQTKATLTFTPVAAGDYKISFYCEVANEEAKRIFVKLYDNTDAVDLTEQTKKMADTQLNGNYEHYGGSIYKTLTAASRTITMQWHGETAGKTSYIRNVYIITERLP